MSQIGNHRIKTRHRDHRDFENKIINISENTTNLDGKSGGSINMTFNITRGGINKNSIFNRQIHVPKLLNLN